MTAGNCKISVTFIHKRNSVLSLYCNSTGASSGTGPFLCASKKQISYLIVPSQTLGKISEMIFKDYKEKASEVHRKDFAVLFPLRDEKTGSILERFSLVRLLCLLTFTFFFLLCVAFSWR